MNNKPESWQNHVDFTPVGSNGIKYYAAANFSVAWRREDADQVGSVLSRTGNIIKSENFPIIWVSKIQTEIVLSTTEAEYISLINIMEYLIPLRHIMLEVSSIFGMKCDSCNS